MKNLIHILLLTIIFLALGGCWAIQKGNTYEGLAPGIWRGLFMIGEGELAEKVPINFEVLNSDNDQPIQLEFINGASRLKADSLRFWGDTLYVYFHNTPKYLRLIHEAGLVEGFLYDGTKKEYPIEFYAQYGEKHRFLDLRKPPTSDISGAWAMDILDETGEIIAARLDLTVHKNKVLATLKTEQDSLPQSLEGTIQSDKILLSAFTGEQVLFFRADLRDSVTLGRATIYFNERVLACNAKKVR